MLSTNLTQNGNCSKLLTFVPSSTMNEKNFLLRIVETFTLKTLKAIICSNSFWMLLCMYLCPTCPWKCLVMLSSFDTKSETTYHLHSSISGKHNQLEGVRVCHLSWYYALVLVPPTFASDWYSVRFCCFWLDLKKLSFWLLVVLTHCLNFRLLKITFQINRKSTCFVAFHSICSTLWNNTVWKNSIKTHFNRSKIFLLNLYAAYDVNPWEKNLEQLIQVRLIHAEQMSWKTW